MSPDLPTPADIAPAHVVRIRMMSGRVYTSPIRTPQETVEAADALQQIIEHAATGTGFVHFRTDTESGPVVRLRADRIESIEPVRPPAHRPRPTPAPIVHVHLHTTETPEGAEPYLGLSTGRVLELIRAEQRGTFDPRPAATLQQEDALPDEVAGGAL